MTKNADQLRLAVEIGARVLALRQARKWSQERLARQSTLSRETIRRTESGRGFPDLASLGAIASALEVDWEDLLPAPSAISEAHIERYPQTPADLLLPVPRKRRRAGNRPESVLEPTG